MLGPTSSDAWIYRWWRVPGLYFTSAVLMAYGVFMLLSRDEQVGWFFPSLAVVSGVLMFGFAAFPWSPCLFYAASVSSFFTWFGQATRLVIQVLDGGVHDNDYRASATALAFLYFSLVVWVMAAVYVKPWHYVMWGRHQARKDDRAT